MILNSSDKEIIEDKRRVVGVERNMVFHHSKTVLVVEDDSK